MAIFLKRNVQAQQRETDLVLRSEDVVLFRTCSSFQKSKFRLLYIGFLKSFQVLHSPEEDRRIISRKVKNHSRLGLSWPDYANVDQPL